VFLTRAAADSARILNVHGAIDAACTQKTSVLLLTKSSLREHETAANHRRIDFIPTAGRFATKTIRADFAA
jgi:hypothetical protein